jgi:hypothetical protein
MLSRPTTVQREQGDQGLVCASMWPSTFDANTGAARSFNEHVALISIFAPEK